VRLRRRVLPNASLTHNDWDPPCHIEPLHFVGGHARNSMRWAVKPALPSLAGVKSSGSMGAGHIGCGGTPRVAAKVRHREQQFVGEATSIACSVQRCLTPRSTGRATAGHLGPD